jgi:class 3 adenylate cyclase
MDMPETFSLQGRIFFVRLLFCMTTLALLAANDAFCRGQPGDHPWLLVGGILYPLLGHVLFGRLDISRRRGHVLFLADGTFVGAVIAAVDVALLPGVVLAVISLFSWMVVGGAMLVALGMLFMLLGMLTMGINPFAAEFVPTAGCAVSNWLASLIAVAYFLIVARIIHRLIGELRLQQVEFQARSDSASSAQVMAEQALLAVLPPSAAEKMADSGKFVPERIEATMLLLDFRTDDKGSPGLEGMQDALLVSDRILARHGFELIKSFGSQALAASRNPSGPDAACAAFREIATFFKDRGHPIASLRGILHHGAATLGLVQPERLNLDLFGTPLDELARLATASSMQAPGLFASASVYRLLSKPSDFSPLPDEASRPACYRHSA